MFFLINAADLAESEEELEMVKGYIADQLLQYGIRNHVYLQFQVYVRLKRNKEKILRKRSTVFYKTLGLLSSRNHLHPL